jgi:NAD+ synthetase
MQIALAQINPTIGDFHGNLRKVAGFADRAKAAGCRLVVFSELALSGYPPRDLLEKPDFVDSNRRCLEDLVARLRGIGVVIGTLMDNPADDGKTLFNGAVLFEDGKRLGECAKRLLPTYDVFDERRYFEPGEASRPLDFHGHRIGLTICEDAWNDKDFFGKRMYALDPVALLADDGAELVVNISASPYHIGKGEMRRRMLAAQASKHRVPLLFANQVGGNDDLVFDGLSAAFDATGRVVAQARDFDEDLIVVDWTAGEGLTADPGQRHPESASDAASIMKALVVGTRDYVRKCGFSTVVIGLSGGIDSAVTAAVAVEALGRENVATVFMPSVFTSRENHEDTRTLAENLGVAYRVIPIEGLFGAFTGALGDGTGAGSHDVTEQNLQARIRGTLLMAISNRSGCLVLSTGNKSELAVGYCTLYGDMNGGLAVISDVPKTMVYEIARHVNRERAVIPPRILTKAPSAELKPGQTDQDDLPPYEVLDAVLKGYIESCKGPDDLIAEGFDPALVHDVIRRVDRNEYKRHQAAPGIKVTSKAFGYGRRYPIAQQYRYESTP